MKESKKRYFEDKANGVKKIRVKIGKINNRKLHTVEGNSSYQITKAEVKSKKLAKYLAKQSKLERTIKPDLRNKQDEHNNKIATKALAIIISIKMEIKRRAIQSAKDKAKYKTDMVIFKKAHPKNPNAYHWEDDREHWLYGLTSKKCKRAKMLIRQVDRELKIEAKLKEKNQKLAQAA